MCISNNYNLPFIPKGYQIPFLPSWMFEDRVKVKLKVTLVQARRICTGRTAHRWGRGIALL
jgi:hypothetical protein